MVAFSGKMWTALLFLIAWSGSSQISPNEKSMLLVQPALPSIFLRARNAILLFDVRTHHARFRLLLDLQTARNEAHQASQAKSNFLNALSHELRGPLQPVMLGLDTLLEQKDDHRFSPEVVADLETIRSQVQLVGAPILLLAFLLNLLACFPHISLTGRRFDRRSVSYLFAFLCPRFHIFFCPCRCFRMQIY
jgi:signal transduction histidine kinase